MIDFTTDVLEKAFDLISKVVVGRYPQKKTNILFLLVFILCDL